MYSIVNLVTFICRKSLQALDFFFIVNHIQILNDYELKSKVLATFRHPHPANVEHVLSSLFYEFISELKMKVILHFPYLKPDSWTNYLT